MWLAVSLTLVRVRPRGWRVGLSGRRPRLRETLAPSRVGWRPCDAACICQNGSCARVLELGVHGGRPAALPACASSARPARAPRPVPTPVSPCPQPEACRTLAPERDKPAKHCSIQLPDGTACVVLVRAGLSIKDVLAGLCERHGINGAAVDLFLAGGDKVRLRGPWAFLRGVPVPWGAGPPLSVHSPLPEARPGARPGCELPLQAALSGLSSGAVPPRPSARPR